MSEKREKSIDSIRVALGTHSPDLFERILSLLSLLFLFAPSSRLNSIRPLFICGEGKGAINHAASQARSSPRCFLRSQPARSSGNPLRSQAYRGWLADWLPRRCTYVRMDGHMSLFVRTLNFQLGEQRSGRGWRPSFLLGLSFKQHLEPKSRN